MLTTHQDHKIPMFPFATGEGTCTWRAVTMHVGIPYIFISYSIKEGRQWISQTTAFWRHEDVLGFCRQVNKDKKQKILDVFMLVPASQEAAHKLAFLRIREIFVGRLRDADIDFPRYITTTGEPVGERLAGTSDWLVECSGSDDEILFQGVVVS